MSNAITRKSAELDTLVSAMASVDAGLSIDATGIVVAEAQAIVDSIMTIPGWADKFAGSQLTALGFTPTSLVTWASWDTEPGENMLAALNRILTSTHGEC